MSFASGLALVVQLEGGMYQTTSLEDPPTLVFAGIRKDIYERAGYSHWPPTPEEVANYYRKEYWDEAKCDLLPEPSDSVLFQAAVHMGPAKAIQCLQCAVMVRPIDGGFGPETERHVNAMNRLDLPDLILTAQDAKYVFGANQEWKKGFLDRTDKVRKAIAEGMI